MFCHTWNPKSFSLESQKNSFQVVPLIFVNDHSIISTSLWVVEKNSFIFMIEGTVYTILHSISKQWIMVTFLYPVLLSEIMVFHHFRCSVFSSVGVTSPPWCHWQLLYIKITLNPEFYHKLQDSFWLCDFGWPVIPYSNKNRRFRRAPRIFGYELWT
jgi:hypothetical protein